MSFGSRFLYAEDLLHGGEFRDAEVQISEFHKPHSLKAADGKPIDKPSLGFDGRDKLLVLCKTNVQLIKFATGEALTDKWIGKKIVLTVRLVESFGEKVPAIRVKSKLIRKGLLKHYGEPLKWQG
jgi:hypothetical protein